MAKFKVGDLVKVVKKVTEQEGWDDSYYWSDMMNDYIGNEYVIYEMRDNGVKLQRDKSSIHPVFPFGSVELVAQKLTIDDVKVGDRVKVARLGDEDGCWISDMDEFVGGEYTIIRIDESDDTVQFSEDSYRWWFPIDTLELAVSKYLDGVAVSVEEFARRTAAPVEMTEAEVSAALGYVVKFKA